MSRIDALLNERMGPTPPSAKVKALAKQSADGSLSSFSGLFKVGLLSENEKEALAAILRDHQTTSEDIQNDLQSLISITCEVKAIHNQAALLHGERIKRVQTILKNYKEGAFTAWLYAAYGNRQTPYNFLVYFEFCQALPNDLKQKVDTMPRQAIYALASRQVPIEQKQEIIITYSGQTKREVLEIIRAAFPLDKQDKRRTDDGEVVFSTLNRLFQSFKRLKSEIDPQRQQELKKLLTRFLNALD